MLYRKAIASPQPCLFKWTFQASFNSFIPKAFDAQVSLIMSMAQYFKNLAAFCYLKDVLTWLVDLSIGLLMLLPPLSLSGR